jgi:NNP family nitrate/nitrite transporter-like MFS transporter
MTFGSFSGLAATFPLLIKGVYGGFPNAPDPLKYAFLGPLVGSLMRIIFGPISDKLGGGILTHVSGLGLIAGCLLMVFSGILTPTSLDTFPYFVATILGLFFFSGMGNASTFRQYPIIFGHSPRQAAGVLGWTAAVAAYGPFIFSSLIGAVVALTGNSRGFFLGWTLFCAVATIINWWFYTRKGCEKPC